MKLSKDLNILIVGLGLLGGSYARTLKQKGFKVSAITKNQDDIDFAIEMALLMMAQPNLILKLSAVLT